MKVTYPILDDYDSLEEYEEALEAYDAAESAYEDECVESYYEEIYEI